MSGIDPVTAIRLVALGMRASRALEAVARLGVADVLADGPRSSGEIAAATSTDALSIRRVLRALAAFGIFEEREPDLFALNQAADMLRTEASRSMKAGAMFLAGDLRWRLWADLRESIRTGEPAFGRVLGSDMFTYYETHAEEAALFNNAMASFSAGMSPAILAAYDFSHFRCLVDVGGGTGRLLADILAANAALAGILFDLPRVVAAAPAVLQAGGVAARCRIESGSFFDAVPAGGDAYLLKFVLHDWDDARAEAILTRCRAAAAEGATLLIVERVMPERAQAGQAAEAYLLDLEMLVATLGGRERTESEFRTLLAATGFELLRVVPTTSPVSVLEARAVAR
jgi:O-methyltransferase domain/Dimerisation domain